MNLAMYLNKYSSNSSGPMIANRKKIDSNSYWVEYSLDMHDMQKLLMSTKNLKEKYQLMDMIDMAERKKNWHYRQENFNLNRASEMLQAMLRANYVKI